MKNPLKKIKKVFTFINKLKQSIYFLKLGLKKYISKIIQAFNIKCSVFNQKRVDFKQ